MFLRLLIIIIFIPAPKMRFNLKMMMWYLTVWFGHLLKRLLDIGIYAVMLVILSPLLVLVAIAIKLESKGAVIYCSVRVGKDGRHFTFYKFRSMRVGVEASARRNSPQKRFGGRGDFQNEKRPENNPRRQIHKKIFHR